MHTHMAILEKELGVLWEARHWSLHYGFAASNSSFFFKYKYINILIKSLACLRRMSYL